MHTHYICNNSVHYSDAEAIKDVPNLRSVIELKKTMTLNMTEAEMSVLEVLSARKDLTKTAVMKQALRLYQLVDARLARGETLFFEDELKKKKSELMVL